MYESQEPGPMGHWPPRYLSFFIFRHHLAVPCLAVLQSGGPGLNPTWLHNQVTLGKLIRLAVSLSSLLKKVIVSIAEGSPGSQMKSCVWSAWHNAWFEVSAHWMWAPLIIIWNLHVHISTWLLPQVPQAVQWKLLPGVGLVRPLFQECPRQSSALGSDIWFANGSVSWVRLGFWTHSLEFQIYWHHLWSLKTSAWV